jgi:hypothetical protein
MVAAAPTGIRTRNERATLIAMSREPRQIVWFMLHSGYLRYFGSTVRLLAERGHHVHIAFARTEKDPGDARLVEALVRTHPTITAGEAPRRPRRDGWRPIATAVRGFTDLARYSHPRYAEAPALRARMARKLAEHVHTGRGADPLIARFTLRIAHLVASHSSERFSRRAIGALAGVERAIPTSSPIDDYLRTRKPDAVLASPVIEFASSQVEYLKSANKLGIPCAVGVASWDNLTGKGLIRVVPDRVYVWNATQVEEAVEQHGVPRERVVATGAAKFDEWFERSPSCDSAAFTKRVGLDPGHPYVLYVCSSPFIAPDEVAFVRTWLARLRADARTLLRDAGVLVRPHPQNAAQWAGVELGEFRNAVVWPPAGAQPDAGEARADFFDSLAHSAAVVGINTSALLEAAVVGKVVLVPSPPEFAGTQEGTLHFRYLLAENGGFVHVGGTLDRHLDQLADAIERGDDHAAETRAFVESFLRPCGVDRPAAPILADAIEQLAAAQPEPARRTTRSVLLHAVLVPAAIVAGVLGYAADRLRRAPLTSEPV